MNAESLTFLYQSAYAMSKLVDRDYEWLAAVWCYQLYELTCYGRIFYSLGCICMWDSQTLRQYQNFTYLMCSLAAAAVQNFDYEDPAFNGSRAAFEISNFADAERALLNCQRR